MAFHYSYCFYAKLVTNSGTVVEQSTHDHKFEGSIKPPLALEGEKIAQGCTVEEQSTRNHRFYGLNQATPSTRRRENSAWLHIGKTSNS
jgi:hypothetical protein